LCLGSFKKNAVYLFCLKKIVKDTTEPARIGFDQTDSDIKNFAGSDFKVNMHPNDNAKGSDYAPRIENSSSTMEDEEIMQNKPPQIELEKPQPGPFPDKGTLFSPRADAAAGKDIRKKHASILTEDSSASPTASSLPLHPSSMTSSPRSAELASSEASETIICIELALQKNAGAWR
jgi:hypothetical protein